MNSARELADARQPCRARTPGTPAVPAAPAGRASRTSRQARRASLGTTGAVREDVRPPGAARACRPRRAKRGGILLTSSSTLRLSEGPHTLCRRFDFSRQMTLDSAARAWGRASTWPSVGLFCQSRGEKTFSSRNGHVRQSRRARGNSRPTPDSDGKAPASAPGKQGGPRRSGAGGRFSPRRLWVSVAGTHARPAAGRGTTA